LAMVARSFGKYAEARKYLTVDTSLDYGVLLPSKLLSTFQDQLCSRHLTGVGHLLMGK
jgi:hypothetical protein